MALNMYVPSLHNLYHIDTKGKPYSDIFRFHFSTISLDIWQRYRAFTFKPEVKEHTFFDHDVYLAIEKIN
jgi:hypothetical protein